MMIHPRVNPPSLPSCLFHQLGDDVVQSALRKDIVIRITHQTRRIHGSTSHGRDQLDNTKKDKVKRETTTMDASCT